MASTLIEDTDSDDELPAGWEERVTTNGKVYYAKSVKQTYTNVYTWTEISNTSSQKKNQYTVESLLVELCHAQQATQWTHPINGKKKVISGELPFGWEMKVNDEGNVFFVDHVNRKTTYTDPRLAFATEEPDKNNQEIKQKFDASSTALQILMGRDLSKVHAIVTGANSGIGFETARSLALHGANITLVCRNMKKANDAVKKIKEEKPNAELRVEAMFMDLMDLNSVKQFAENYIKRERPIQILILNAGVFSVPFTRSADGYEATFQTNYLGHFYLTQLLQPVLVKSAPSRVVTLSAESHRFSDLTLNNISTDKLSPSCETYIPIMAYNQSKLCNILFSVELHRRLQHSKVSTFAVHPGNVINTGLSRYWWFWKVLYTFLQPFTKSKQQAAACSVYCATARELDWLGGEYFNNCCCCSALEVTQCKDTAKKLWSLSERMIQEAYTLKKT